MTERQEHIRYMILALFISEIYLFTFKIEQD